MGAQRLGLFDQFLRELAIRRRRKALKACVERVAQAVKDANRAIFQRDANAEKRAQETITRENARYEQLFAELIALEAPDDIVRRGQQA